MSLDRISVRWSVLPAGQTPEWYAQFDAARDAGMTQRCIEMLKDAGWRVFTVENVAGATLPSGGAAVHFSISTTGTDTTAATPPKPPQTS